MRINFDFGDLEAFLAVAELGSFQRASEKLNVSQSAITRRIQKLETALEIRLFNRTTRSLKLTMEAKSFRSRAQTMLDDASEAVHALQDETSRFESQRNSIITIAAIPTSISDLLPRTIKSFESKGYKARIKILDHFANDVTEAVEKGEADFGISFMGMNEPGIEFNFLLEDRFVLALHSDHPLANQDQVHWSELMNQAVIVPWKGTGNRMLVDNELARTRQSLDWSYQVHHSSTALGLVESNIGIAVLPESAIPKKDDSVILSRPLIEPDITRVIGTVRRSNHDLSSVAEAFYQCLVDSILYSMKEEKPSKF